MSFCAKLRNRQSLYYYTGTLGNRSCWSVGGYENGFIRDAADDPAVSRIYWPLCLCAGRVPRSIVGVITIIMLKTTVSYMKWILAPCISPSAVIIKFWTNSTSSTLRDVFTARRGNIIPSWRLEQLKGLSLRYVAYIYVIIIIIIIYLFIFRSYKIPVIWLTPSFLQCKSLLLILSSTSVLLILIFTFFINLEVLHL